MIRNILASAILTTTQAALILIAVAACSHNKPTEVSKTTPAVTNNEKAAQEVNADYYASIAFSKGQAGLTPAAKNEINGLVNEARARGKVDAIKVIAWADTTPRTKNATLPRAQRELADKRAEEIENYIEENLGISDVSKYNMAESTGVFSEVFNTTNAQLKDRLGETASNRSSALVLVTLEK